MEQTQQMGMTASSDAEGVHLQQSAYKAAPQQQGHSEKPVQAGKAITDWASI